MSLMHALFDVIFSVSALIRTFYDQVKAVGMFGRKAFIRLLLAEIYVSRLPRQLCSTSIPSAKLPSAELCL